MLFSKHFEGVEDFMVNSTKKGICEQSSITSWGEFGFVLLNARRKGHETTSLLIYLSLKEKVHLCLFLRALMQIRAVGNL